MFSQNELAMELAKRQKRIVYWRDNFSAATSNQDYIKKANELLRTFSLLLTRLASAKTEQDFDETYQRMLSTEQQLQNLYESCRLLTSVR